MAAAVSAPLKALMAGRKCGRSDVQTCHGKKPPHSGHFRANRPFMTRPLPPHFWHRLCMICTPQEPLLDVRSSYPHLIVGTSISHDKIPQQEGTRLEES